jgi:hypothetical protein
VVRAADFSVAPLIPDRSFQPGGNAGFFLLRHQTDQVQLFQTQDGELPLGSLPDKR